MASAERELIGLTVGSGAEPQRGTEAEPLVSGSGAKPVKAESFSAFAQPEKLANFS